MTAPDAPAGSEHYREGWRDGYDQARIDRDRDRAASAALAGTTTPTANVVTLLLEACRGAEDNRPPCDCAGPPDFGDGIYGSHEGDCASYEFPAVQASYIRALLASTPTEDPS